MPAAPEPGKTVLIHQQAAINERFGARAFTLARRALTSTAQGNEGREGSYYMKLAHFACALGRHSVDTGAVRHIHGGTVSRCRHCATPMEESAPFTWTVQAVRDAGLGDRMLR